uniref:Uncharacterized protein n=1 Tax=Candidatus Kentrum sp. FW TaxID=2126338 RepID=A0A450THX0_9GAMM|nr:MAG: hypothetical protein BECKFW1821C_GA0114237_101084 [Candidatus Kentron sp. FW]
MKAIKAAIGTILQKMPFLINLTVQERKSIAKAGLDSVSFIQNALAAAEDHPDILPKSSSTPEFKNDVELFTQLTELGALIDSLASQVDDTRLAVGGEAMREGTQVYDYVKTAAKTTPGLKPIADQLAERFKKAGKPKKPAETEA